MQLLHDFGSDRGIEIFHHRDRQLSRCLFDQFGGDFGCQQGHQIISITGTHQRDLTQRLMVGQGVDDLRDLRLVGGVQCSLQSVFGLFEVLGIFRFWQFAHDIWVLWWFKSGANGGGWLDQCKACIAVNILSADNL